jgi:hypothetical protein
MIFSLLILDNISCLLISFRISLLITDDMIITSIKILIVRSLSLLFFSFRISQVLDPVVLTLP